MTAKSWLSERLDVSSEDLRWLTSEPVPNHMKRWWYALGGTPAYLFAIQIVTGILLAFYYEPTTTRAYESVAYITEEVRYGWYIRSLHKWGATFMIAAIILHQMRVFFTGAYRKPREINWMIGMCLLLSTLTIAFTGYSLVYEQLSYWGATVGANIADGRSPRRRTTIKRMLLGGDAYNQHTLARFYVLHAAILPALLILFIFVHIAIVRLQGVSELAFTDEPEPEGTFNLFPDHVYIELTIGLALMALLSALATILPATLGPPADPLVTPEIIKPEWFFYVAFRWLKLFSGTVAILSMGFVIFTMFCWPFIDAWIRRHTRFSEASVWIGLAAIALITGLMVWEAAVAH